MKAKLYLLLIVIVMVLSGCKKDEVKNVENKNEDIEQASVTKVEDEQTVTNKDEDYTNYENSEEIQKAIESEEGYSPEDEEKLTDDYFEPETYTENDVVVNIYFTNTEKLDEPGFLTAKAAENISEDVQKYLNNLEYDDVTELKIISGTEVKSESEISFEFEMDTHPGETVKVTYFNDMADFGYELKKPIN